MIKAPGLFVKGFSLIELVTALAVLSVLALFSLGWGAWFSSKNELQSISNEISTAVRYARMQSLLTGKTIYLSLLAGKNKESEGMQLYELDAKHAKIILYQWSWYHPQWRIDWSGFHSTQIIPFSQSPRLAAMNGTFKIVNSFTKQQKSIVINRLGRIQDKV